MGRAKGHTATVSDRFAGVLGTRRGGEDADVDAALSALAGGDIAPALRALLDIRDIGDAPALCEPLAGHLASELADVQLLRFGALIEQLGAQRYGPDGLLEPWDEEEFCAAAAAKLRPCLMARAGEHRAHPQEALSECEAAVEEFAFERAAAHVRRGGAQHLQRMFGRTRWKWMRAELSERLDMHPQSGAVAPLLVEACDAAWLREVAAAVGVSATVGMTASAALVERASSRR